MIVEICVAIAVVLAFAAAAVTAVSATRAVAMRRKKACGVTLLQEPRIGGGTGPRATCEQDNEILECATGRHY